MKLENTTDRDRPTYGPTDRPTDILMEGWTGGRKYCYIGQACISTDERTNQLIEVASERDIFHIFCCFINSIQVLSGLLARLSAPWSVSRSVGWSVTIV